MRINTSLRLTESNFPATRPEELITLSQAQEMVRRQPTPVHFDWMFANAAARDAFFAVNPHSYGMMVLLTDDVTIWRYGGADERPYDPALFVHVPISVFKENKPVFLTRAEFDGLGEIVPGAMYAITDESVLVLVDGSGAYEIGGLDGAVLKETPDPQGLNTTLLHRGGGTQFVSGETGNAVNGLSMGNYQVPDGSGGEATFSQLEVGSGSSRTNINASERPTVETPQGKEQVAYLSDLPNEGDDAGTWTTPYSDPDVEFGPSFSGAVDTGVELEDACEYHCVVSAMGGSVTGSTGDRNALVPVILNDDGSIFSRIADQSAADCFSLMLKGRWEFRWQESEEGDGTSMVLVSSFFDTLLGSVRLTQAQNADRKSAALDGFHTVIMNDAGVAARAEFVPTGTKLRIGFAQFDGAAAPDCDARMLLKVERMRGKKETI